MTTDSTHTEKIEEGATGSVDEVVSESGDTPKNKAKARASLPPVKVHVNYPRGSYFWVPFCRIFLIPLAWAVFRFRWRGTHNLPSTGGFLVTPNHQSFVDPPFMGLAIQKRRYRYMAKEKYFRVPFFGFIMRMTAVFPVDDTRRFDRRAYQMCLDTLKQGLGLVVFPEGTRTRDGLLGTLQTGAARMALQTGVPIVPAVITGAYEAWPRKRKFPKFGERVVLKFYPPIPVGKIENPADMNKRCEEITERLRVIMDRRVRAYRRYREWLGKGLLTEKETADVS